jgi:hypothetical protein
MATIIAFPVKADSRKQTAARARPGASATIMLFIGVRYERMPEPPATTKLKRPRRRPALTA